MRTKLCREEKVNEQTDKKADTAETEEKRSTECVFACVYSDFSGILTFLLLTARDNSKLNSTLDETFDFVKNRIESYEIYNTNDQVKSLVRLLDKQQN